MTGFEHVVPVWSRDVARSRALIIVTVVGDIVIPSPKAVSQTVIFSVRISDKSHPGRGNALSPNLQYCTRPELPTICDVTVDVQGNPGPIPQTETSYFTWTTTPSRSH